MKNRLVINAKRSIFAMTTMDNSNTDLNLHLEVIDRIGNIAIVGSGFRRAGRLYAHIKGNNRVFSWYFGTVEATLQATCESLQPAVKLFEAPLKCLDNAMCKKLDRIEQEINYVRKRMEMICCGTREMLEGFVKPVVRRADSVKQLGNAMLQSPLTTYAADRIDGALTVADKYVDKYLVALDGYSDKDQVDGLDDSIVDANEKGAIRALHHGKQLSRKLRRRLTQRTLAEARALQKQSKEAINIIIYAAELIATDPKLALLKAKELWRYLSEDEPENQARPETLEQLLVLFTRESARRIVHLVNFSVNTTTNIPRWLSHVTAEAAHQVLNANVQMVKLMQALNINVSIASDGKLPFTHITTFYGSLQNLANEFLGYVAMYLSGHNKPGEAKTFSTMGARARSQAQKRVSPAKSNINGIY